MISDTAITISFLVPMALAFAAMAYMLYEAFRGQKHVQALRLFEAGLCFYFIMIYAYSLWGETFYLLRTGVLSRIGISLIFVVIIIDALISRKKCDGP